MSVCVSVCFSVVNMNMLCTVPSSVVFAGFSAESLKNRINDGTYKIYGI